MEMCVVTVLNLQGKIRVYCRSRPLSNDEIKAGHTNVVTSADEFTVELTAFKVIWLTHLAVYMTSRPHSIQPNTHGHNTPNTIHHTNHSNT